MSQFNWQLDVEESWGEPEKQPHPQRPSSPVWFLLVAALIVIALLGVWTAGRRQIAAAEAELRQTLQTSLDLAGDAFRQGDGDLYFAFLTDDPAWRAAQLLPENLAATRAGLTVTRAQTRDEMVWANLAWQADGRTYQRLAFFQWQNGAYLYAATDPSYWGSALSRPADWGELVVHQADEEIAALVSAYVANFIADACPANCVDGRLPFTLSLTDDFRQTAADRTLHVPSPRLVALDVDGRPAAPFWNLLRWRLNDYLDPAVIRFALPPPFVPGVYRMDYQKAAADFMALHPDITIELAPLAELPADLADLAQYDGAALPPTAEMVAAGLVADLSDLARTDPGFHGQDFYDAIWRGANWQDRLWFMPQSAQFDLLYYDSLVYRQASLPEPAWQWRWGDMEADMAALLAQQDYDWGFLDLGTDSLLAYAYNLVEECETTAVAPCPPPLQPTHIAAALTWYADLIQSGQMPTLPEQVDAIARGGASTLQTVGRRAAFWVDEPLYFEYYLLLNPIGVAPFPGAGFLDGVTPLWVDGSFISAGSPHQRAMWQWLNFLSYQPPTPRFRYIPARPSVATKTNYWFTLPRPLVNAMRTAFNGARPVSLAEKEIFTLDRLTAVTDGRVTPLEAAQNPVNIPWFQPSE
ncbi:MAG: ABC transporter substrate-binding protein [Anaerolineae bacterium]